MLMIKTVFVFLGQKIERHLTKCWSTAVFAIPVDLKLKADDQDVVNTGDWQHQRHLDNFQTVCGLRIQGYSEDTNSYY